jgi:hypothetical protein
MVDRPMMPHRITGCRARGGKCRKIKEGGGSKRAGLHPLARRLSLTSPCRLAPAPPAAPGALLVLHGCPPRLRRQPCAALTPRPLAKALPARRGAGSPGVGERAPADQQRAGRLTPSRAGPPPIP